MPTLDLPKQSSEDSLSEFRFASCRFSIEPMSLHPPLVGLAYQFSFSIATGFGRRVMEPKRLQQPHPDLGSPCRLW